MHDLSQPPAIGFTLGGDVDVLAVAQASLVTAASAPDWPEAEQALAAPDRAHVVARYVHGGLPSNSNGHIFRTEELPRIHRYVVGTALDMFHDPLRVIGAHVGSRVVQPLAEKIMRAHEDLAAARSPRPADYADNPYMEILAQVWSYRHPREAKDIATAFEEGTAFVSHSCLPAEVECPTCGKKSPWAGYSSPTYCDHMQGLNDKLFNDPLFLGGAIIIPPVTPGWIDARIRQVRATLAAPPEQTASVAADLAALAGGNLTPTQLEVLAGELVARVHADNPATADSLSRLIGPGWEKRTAGYETDLTLPAELADAVGIDRELTPTELRALVDRAGDGDVDPGLAAWAAGRWTSVVAEDIAHMTRRYTPRSPFWKYTLQDEHGTSGSFPVSNLVELRQAMNAWAAAADPNAVKTHLVERGIDLGAPAEMLTEVALLGVPEAATKKWTTAVVVLAPPRPIAEAVAALSLGQFDADEIHVTLAFLGKVVPQYDPESDTEHPSEIVMLGNEEDGWAGVSSRPYIMGALHAWAARQPRLLARLSGRGTFDQGDAGETVYASIDAPGLEEARASLVAAFDHANIAYSKLHGFTPHMTITDGLPAGTGAQEAPEGQWLVDNVQLWWAGDHMTVPIP